MGFLIKLKHAYHSLSPNEQRIADFILKNPNIVKSSSSKVLAAQVEVSQSAIIKFSQKLGADKFSDFKLAISEELIRQEAQQEKRIHLHDTITDQDDLTEIAEKLFLEKQQALKESLSLNPTKQIAAVIQCLLSAKRIQLMGIGNSALVAKDLFYKLTKIGLPAVTETDTHAQLAMSQSLTSQDALFLISFSGRHREILLAAENARAHQVKIIALTALQTNPLHQLADYVLYSVADESKFRSSSIASRTAQHAITDLLFMGIVQQKNDANVLILESRELIGQLNKFR
ncbi:MurR/RpiR family transcriptional regulator [Pasteurella canis]|uniref:Transcriptional regulator n=1 Tax=Pasteurella canis TaxID=753 RepID=A0ABQ4VJB1_9PAST|nr:MurR/RpiR family transcriptional regulator [Pasteurella canis]MXN88906.1 SIS domain-containing protein [Pasteurella canis]UAY77477.1 MurR/RpiR family transcriptional regulator [Pasteurella canis]UEA16566.1 MurR/RpiR family transcriptional regulator [Pasteurella canis]UEC23005.1 MurR/RpiR family transcriptional regulator [Pasteurella canis]SPY34097.1 HTH-type transcriptional regulator MurR [Pasteurella canis]